MKLNIGSGRLRFPGFTNLDCTQIIDGNGKEMVDLIIDLEKEKLPYEDNSVEKIKVDNVLEHVSNLKGLLNECHRVFQPGGILSGIVPVAGSEVAFGDPTHVRFFNKRTFDYFTGHAGYDESKPSHPRYADYGYLSWNYVGPLVVENDLIWFKLTPIK